MGKEENNNIGNASIDEAMLSAHHRGGDGMDNNIINDNCREESYDQKESYPFIGIIIEAVKNRPKVINTSITIFATGLVVGFIILLATYFDNSGQGDVGYTGTSLFSALPSPKLFWLIIVPLILIPMWLNALEPRLSIREQLEKPALIFVEGIIFASAVIMGFVGPIYVFAGHSLGLTVGDWFAWLAFSVGSIVVFVLMAPFILEQVSKNRSNQFRIYISIACLIIFIMAIIS